MGAFTHWTVLYIDRNVTIFNFKQFKVNDVNFVGTTLMRPE